MHDLHIFVFRVILQYEVAQIMYETFKMLIVYLLQQSCVLDDNNSIVKFSGYDKILYEHKYSIAYRSFLVFS